MNLLMVSPTLRQYHFNTVFIQKFRCFSDKIPLFFRRFSDFFNLISIHGDLFLQKSGIHTNLQKH